MNNFNKMIDKNKILLNNDLFNGGKVEYDFLIKLSKLYNKHAIDTIYIHNDMSKKDILNILIDKLNKVDDSFFDKVFINKNDLINYIKLYNKKNKDKIKYLDEMSYNDIINILKKKFIDCTEDLCIINELNRNKLTEKKIKDFKKDENTKCAPHLKYDNGSCFTREKLLDMAINYNKKFKNDKNYKEIIVTDKTQKSDLVFDLSNRLSNCNNQICWLSKIYNNKKDIINYFRPDGPEKQFKWLNTTNINLVMKQYEKKYKDYKFFGAVPIDFDNPIVSDILFIDYNDLFNKGINRIGFIFNLDRHDQGGSHWVGLFCNLKNKLIYFFDSYGTNPYEDRKYKNISILMSRIYNYLNNSLNLNWIEMINNLHTLYDNDNIDKCLQLYETNIKFINSSGQLSNNIDFNYFNKTNIDLNFANIRHQYGNSECGVYSIYFILIMLLDDNNFYKKFYEKLTNKNDIISGKQTNKIINDNLVNQCRDEYFNFTDLLISNSF